jgi:hypothetical protein
MTLYRNGNKMMALIDDIDATLATPRVIFERAYPRQHSC